eukprot:1818904-Rhodomonas_salina.3
MIISGATSTSRCGHDRYCVAHGVSRSAAGPARARDLSYLRCTVPGLDSFSLERCTRRRSLTETQPECQWRQCT